VRLLSKLVEAHWCTAARDAKSRLSCLPGCSCVPPQHMKSCQSEEAAVERTTAEVKLLAVHGKRRETKKWLE